MMIRPRKCALTGSETGAYKSGVGHRSARFRAYRGDTMPQKKTESPGNAFLNRTYSATSSA